MAHHAETQWLREFSAQKPLDAADIVYDPAAFARAGISLPDIRRLFRKGSVTVADKTDAAFSDWIVEGTDFDGHPIGAALRVHTQEYSVQVCRAWKATPTNEA